MTPGRQMGAVIAKPLRNAMQAPWLYIAKFQRAASKGSCPEGAYGGLLLPSGIITTVDHKFILNIFLSLGFSGQVPLGLSLYTLPYIRLPVNG